MTKKRSKKNKVKILYEYNYESEQYTMFACTFVFDALSELTLRVFAEFGAAIQKEVSSICTRYDIPNCSGLGGVQVYAFKDEVKFRTKQLKKGVSKLEKLYDSLSKYFDKDLFKKVITGENNNGISN